jgi:hypothetical protein
MSGHFPRGSLVFDLLLPSGTDSGAIEARLTKSGMRPIERDDMEWFETEFSSSSPLRRAGEVRVVAAIEELECDSDGNAALDLRPYVERLVEVATEFGARVSCASFVGWFVPFAIVVESLLDVAAVALSMEANTIGADDLEEASHNYEKFHRRRIERYEQELASTSVSAIEESVGSAVRRVSNRHAVFELFEPDGTFAASRGDRWFDRIVEAARG